MNSSIEHIYTLYTNPFILSPLILEFYLSSRTYKDHDILLLSLILPLVLYPDSNSYLQNISKRSTLRTFLKDRLRIAGLNSRIACHFSTSQLCLQHLIDQGSAEMQENMSVKILKPMRYDNSIYLKAATGLCKLFQPHDIPTIYRSLGVRQYEIYN